MRRAVRRTASGAQEGPQRRAKFLRVFQGQQVRAIEFHQARAGCVRLLAAQVLDGHGQVAGAGQVQHRHGQRRQRLQKLALSQQTGTSGKAGCRRGVQRGTDARHRLGVRRRKPRR